MKALLVVMLVSATAQADVFAFKDLAGYEKCMTLDHLVETVTTDTGAQTRLLSQEEIQPRCIASAVKLLSGTKHAALILEFIKTTRRLAAPEAALNLAGVLVDASRAACNDVVVYEVLLAGLSEPTDDRFHLPTAEIRREALSREQGLQEGLPRREGQHRCANRRERVPESSPRKSS